MYGIEEMKHMRNTRISFFVSIAPHMYDILGVYGSITAMEYETREKETAKNEAL